MENTNNKKLEVSQKLFNGKEIRFVKINDEIKFVGRDICDVLELSYYYLGKVPKEHKELTYITTKTGAYQKAYLFDFRAIEFLCSYTSNDIFNGWVNSEFYDGTKIELQTEQPVPNKAAIENISKISNKLTEDKIKLLNNVLEKFNSNDKKKEEIVLSLLKDFGI